MNIQPTQNYSTQFKAGYPVVHWVRETNGSYAPALTHELNVKLQKPLVRLLNSQMKKVKPDKLALMEYVKKVICAKDKDYSQNPIARSFYNSQGGWNNQSFEPIGYLVTGRHAEHMTETLGKPIGKAKSEAPQGAEVNIALSDYFKRGLTFVKKLASGFKTNRTHYSLHTKYEVIRTKTGKIKEYRLIDIKFCPTEGSENPFVRTGYVKQ